MALNDQDSEYLGEIAEGVFGAEDVKTVAQSLDIAVDTWDRIAAALERIAGALESIAVGGTRV